MSKFDRRTVIAAGSALVTGSSFAAIGSGNETGESSESEETATDESEDAEPDDVRDADVVADPANGWSSFRGGPGNTGAVPAEGDLEGLGGAAWSYEGVAVDSGAVAVADDTVYARTPDGEVHALDAADGSFEWTSGAIGADESTVNMSDGITPVVADDGVYVGGERLTALDPASGDVRWTQGFDGTEMVFQPELGFGTVYAITGEYGERKFHAVNPTDGSVRWTRESVDAAGTDSFAPNSLAVTAEAVYAAVGDGSSEREIVALEPATGETLWTFDPEDDARSRLVAAGERVFVTTPEETIVLDAATGERERNVPGNRLLAVADGTALTASGDGLHAIDLETGDERWSYDTGSVHGPAILGETAVSLRGCDRLSDDGEEVVGREYHVVGFDLEDGSDYWEFSLADLEHAPDSDFLRPGLPIVDGETVYLLWDGTLTALR
ncbi:hypothetical protein CV102_06550 [Natronococcus pandeyae]|uniref:Pyrrolo-quinoline quinone repeat domain-containing protein n=1 Tax=Natronococcus pandeyae TaxID=2055836 RepID=A0A8J8TT90_9EURY|nr:PQQ-binding-like beta-propeller repeat protein [Natronococcus pandeyae]TYL39925.1 hypothetical protein CV102_06550 [Natronococcus pandeyae]